MPGKLSLKDVQKMRPKRIMPAISLTDTVQESLTLVVEEKPKPKGKPLPPLKSLKIKRRKAAKVEEYRPVLETKETYKTPKGVFQRYKRRALFNCIACGQLAEHVACFQLDGIQVMEKYCSQCLDKYVIW